MSAPKPVRGSKPFRIAIANNKGGVAKSTTAANLAAGLAKRGYRVLLVDFDPSGGVSAFVGLAERIMETERHLASVTDLLESGIFSPIRNHLVPGLDVLPATQRLADVAERMAMQPGSHHWLASRLEPHCGEYDFVLVDTQPTLSKLLLAALMAAPSVVLPIQAERANMPMVISFLTTVEGLAAGAQPEARILGVLPTFFNARAHMPQKMLEELGALFGEGVLFSKPIARRQSISDAMAAGRPIVLAKPADEGALEYTSFIEEVIRRAEQR